MMFRILVGAVLALALKLLLIVTLPHAWTGLMFMLKNDTGPTLWRVAALVLAGGVFGYATTLGHRWLRWGLAAAAASFVTYEGPPGLAFQYMAFCAATAAVWGVCVTTDSLGKE